MPLYEHLCIVLFSVPDGLIRLKYSNTKSLRFILFAVHLQFNYPLVQTSTLETIPFKVSKSIVSSVTWTQIGWEIVQLGTLTFLHALDEIYNKSPRITHFNRSSEPSDWHFDIALCIYQSLHTKQKLRRMIVNKFWLGMTRNTFIIPTSRK